MYRPPETPVQTERLSARALVVAFAARTVLNAAFRVVYPFLPALADGLGVSVTAAAQLVNARVVAGFGAPLLGFLPDRYGRRHIMALALLTMALAGLLLVGWPAPIPAAIAFGMYGLAKVLYDPSVHAYIGDAVPFERRGRAVGIVELSWSAGWLLGVPASGFLIDRWGWKAPWAFFTLLALGSAAFIWCGLPPVGHKRGGRDLPPLRLMAHAWRPRHTRLILTVAVLIALSIEIPFIVYGAWLESTFALSLTGLGLVSVVVGVAEAVAEVGTTLVTDRLGKRRSVLLGLCGMGIALALLPLLPRWGLAATLAGLGFLMLAFEFGLVSLIPLVSESVPDARATAVALSVTAFSLGRFAGGAVGGWLWRWEEIALHSLLAIIFAGIAVMLLVLNAEDRLRPPPAAQSGEAV